MKNDAPLVLVAMRHRDDAASEAIQDALRHQTYSNTRLVVVHDDEEEKFEALAKGSSAEFVLFWPDGGTLREAAIEKLVLALQLAPDQQGVADAAQGSTGLWLARIDETTTPLIGFWLTSQVDFIGTGLKSKAKFFHIAEYLMTPCDQEIPHPYAVEQLFGKLPLELKNFEPIATEALWEIAEATPDEHSVLFLVTSLPMGGACKFILDIASQLKAQGYRVTVATTTHDTENANPWLDELLRIIPDVFVLSQVRPAQVPRLIIHLARTRNCGRVVVSHSMLGYQLLPHLRTELPGVAFLDYTHIEYETEWPDGGYALRSINSQPLLDAAMVSSHHLRQWMVEHGGNPDVIRVCHTNIDTAKWTPSPEMRTRVRQELGIDKKTTLILYPCRLADQKRPELLCNIVANLRRETKSPFVVVVAGDGPLMTPLKNFIAKEKIGDCVRLLGAVSLKRVAQLHNAADIFLLPSLIEGIALALFEAMALESVPVVADVGGQRELVTPDCGDLIPLGNVKRELTDYVTALKQLIEHPEQRQRMATACRARVADHFRLEQMTTNFMAALTEAGVRHVAQPATLPPPSICREMAVLAIDHVRVSIDNLVKVRAVFALAEKMDKQDKVIQRLQRQIETLRAAREENEPAY